MIHKLSNTINTLEIDVKYSGPKFYCPICKRNHYYESGWGRDCIKRLQRKGLSPLPEQEEGKKIPEPPKTPQGSNEKPIWQQIRTLKSKMRKIFRETIKAGRSGQIRRAESLEREGFQVSLDITALKARGNTLDNYETSENVQRILRGILIKPLHPKIRVAKGIIQKNPLQYGIRINQINEVIRSAPKHALDSCRGISIYELCEDAIDFQGFRNPGAYYNVENHRVTVGLKDKRKNPLLFSALWLKTAVMHELGHVLDYNNLNDLEKSMVQQLYLQNQTRLREEYAGTNAVEFFAECYAHAYYSNENPYDKSWIRKLSSDVEPFFNSILNKYDFLLENENIIPEAGINGIKFSYFVNDKFEVIGTYRIPEDISYDDALEMVNEGKAQFENVDKYFDVVIQDFISDSLENVLMELAYEFDLQNDFLTYDAEAGTPRGPGRPRLRGLKAGTPGAKMSGAKRTTVGQSLAEVLGPEAFEIGMPETITVPFSMINTETGMSVQGEIVENLEKNIIELTPVSSSNVKAAGQFKNELLVQFYPGKLQPQRTYRYMFERPEMAREAYKSLISSGSPGRWIWQNIRGHTAGERVTSTKLAPSLSPPGKGLPTIGGTTASLVEYSISNRVPVDRVEGFGKMSAVLKRQTSNPVQDPQTGSRMEKLLSTRRELRELNLSPTKLPKKLGQLPRL